MAHELNDAVNPTRSSQERWSRDLGGVCHEQAIVVTDSPDSGMKDLRNFVRSLGGSVHALHPAVHALTVQLRADQVPAPAQRADVLSGSPNRIRQRTASTLESIAGVLTANVRPTSSKTAYTALDGSGIGIAVLDSGMMSAHAPFSTSA